MNLLPGYNSLLSAYSMHYAQVTSTQQEVAWTHTDSNQPRQLSHWPLRTNGFSHKKLLSYICTILITDHLSF